MPFVISLLAGLVTSTFVKALLVRAAVGLGISMATYTGVAIVGSSMMTVINANYSALPPEFLVILNMMHIPQFMNIVFSAYSGSMLLRGLTSSGAVSTFRATPSAGSIFESSGI